jgi:hypothetical protein
MRSSTVINDSTAPWDARAAVAAAVGAVRCVAVHAMSHTRYHESPSRDALDDRETETRSETCREIEREQIILENGRKNKHSSHPESASPVVG